MKYTPEQIANAQERAAWFISSSEGHFDAVEADHVCAVLRYAASAGKKAATAKNFDLTVAYMAGKYDGRKDQRLAAQPKDAGA